MRRMVENIIWNVALAVVLLMAWVYLCWWLNGGE